MGEAFLWVLVIIYACIGSWGVKYFKREILGIVAEFDTVMGLIIKPVFWGLALGWIAAPISLLHWLIIGRNR